ncbi:uncharacterized protein BO66DRAFT_390942 [Aspergillus aculeatinus CBS 121060]|uniref:Uncharacterized protein n=1 Tax=Aspergillus aculeatinus CBS 121060 TaxID=1448322 RepID=A0ACD1HD56_9EURO|nr:hypothetical protein BO66DRAFT_390942 [Aspergillus aculeatinus CBS 121060]RAH71369.1 hypothetical protein BO66DRAFT_390942 [Aspergillus aculeatinus CBS 121060]
MSRHLQLYELVKRPNTPKLPYTNASNPILHNLPEVFYSPVQFQSDTLTPPPPPPLRFSTHQTPGAWPTVPPCRHHPNFTAAEVFPRSRQANQRTGKSGSI